VKTVLLQGIVGSTAYGLAGPHSDVDRLGVYAALTWAFHGLRLPIDKDYLGYASQQFTRLLHKGTDPRTPKHARHLLRLLHQGEKLYGTGELTVRLTDPQRYHDFGAAVAADPAVAQDALDEARQRFSTLESALPDRPDEATVEAWLLRVREHHLES
jgi:hypothetical protein